MRQISSHTPGPPSSLVLENAQEPVPVSGEVLIRVAAAGLNFADALMINDQYQVRHERPFAPGIEVAGVIETIGPAVTRFNVGDRVAAILPVGGFAEFAIAPAETCYAIPRTMPFEIAAASLVTYGTVYHALKRQADLRSGETLLALGCGGGVGMASVDIGSALGAFVVAGGSSKEKVEAVCVLGAEKGFVYADPTDKAAAIAFTKELRSLCPTGGWDVASDPVGGAFVAPVMRAAQWQSRYLVLGFPAGIPSVPLNLALVNAASIIGVFWGEAVKRDPAAAAVDMASLYALWEEGKIAPRPPEIVALPDVPDAIARLHSRSVVGKIVAVMH